MLQLPYCKGVRNQVSNQLHIWFVWVWKEHVGGCHMRRFQDEPPRLLWKLPTSKEGDCWTSNGTSQGRYQSCSQPRELIVGGGECNNAQKNCLTCLAWKTQSRGLVSSKGRRQSLGGFRVRSWFEGVTLGETWMEEGIWDCRVSMEAK